MAYVGNTPTTQSFISGTDYFNGTGAQTAFTLSRTVASVNDIQAVVNNVVQVPNDAYTISGTTITFTSAPSAGTNNVYVRYLSTTTQAITPSQNTVSWNTLDSNTQNDLGLMYKNKIINGNMAIDQRNAGASVNNGTGATNAFPVDRWALYGSQATKCTGQRNAGSVTPPTGFVNYLGVTSSSAYSVLTGDYFNVYHRIEGFNTADLGWGTANAKTITLSFWVRSSLTGTFGGSLSNNAFNRSYPFTYTISSANTWEQKSLTIAGDTTGTWATDNSIGISVYFNLGSGSTYSGTAGAWTGSGLFTATGATSVVGTNGATFYLTGVQLEVGTQATAFSTAGGSYGAELALCQRYYYRFTATSTINTFGLQAYASSAAFGKLLDLPVQMRSAPTALASPASSFFASNATGSPTTAYSTVVVGNVTPNTLGTSGWTGSSGMVAGNMSVVVMSNGAYIEASAEL